MILEGEAGLLFVSLCGIGLAFFIFIMVMWGKEIWDEWSFWSQRKS